jgi:Asp-tRNA(Asn)/Glu-tRNA(Gln) amidotransferase B subunit
VRFVKRRRSRRFVGRVMRETQGKANAKIVNELLRKKLEA